MSLPNVTFTLRARRLVLAFAALAALVAVGAVVHAQVLPQKKPHFKLAVTPGKTTMDSAGTTVYKIELKRVSGFDRPVRLGVVGLPEGTAVAWRYPDGRTLPRAVQVEPQSGRRRSPVLTGRQTTAYLVVFMNGRTRSGDFRPLITATRKGIRRRRWQTLTIGRPQSFSASSLNFQVLASPPSRSVLQGDQTQFDVDVDHDPQGPAPALSVQGLPAGATAVFAGPSASDPRRWSLTVQTARSTPTGTYDLSIKGTRGAASSTAATSLVVTRTYDFTIADGLDGGFAARLAPGIVEPIGLTFTNPYDFALRLMSLEIGVSTTRAGCPAGENFAMTQLDLSEPVMLPPGSSRLEDLVPASKLPRLTMLNLDTDQDACKGVPITLTYSALAGR